MLTLSVLGIADSGVGTALCCLAFIAAVIIFAIVSLVKKSKSGPKWTVGNSDSGSSGSGSSGSGSSTNGRSRGGRGSSRSGDVGCGGGD